MFIQQVSRAFAFVQSPHCTCALPDFDILLLRAPVDCEGGLFPQIMLIPFLCKAWLPLGNSHVIKFGILDKVKVQKYEKYLKIQAGVFQLKAPACEVCSRLASCALVLGVSLCFSQTRPPCPTFRRAELSGGEAGFPCLLLLEGPRLQTFPAPQATPRSHHDVQFRDRHRARVWPEVVPQTLRVSLGPPQHGPGCFCWFEWVSVCFKHRDSATGRQQSSQASGLQTQAVSSPLKLSFHICKQGVTQHCLTRFPWGSPQAHTWKSTAMPAAERRSGDALTPS